MRGAPQILAGTVKEQMLGTCFRTRTPHSPVYWLRERGIMVLVLVDDFLCTRAVDFWLFDTFKAKADWKQHVLESGSGKEVKYLKLV